MGANDLQPPQDAKKAGGAELSGGLMYPSVCGEDADLQREVRPPLLPSCSSISVVVVTETLTRSVFQMGAGGIFL